MKEVWAGYRAFSLEKSHTVEEAAHADCVAFILVGFQGLTEPRHLAT